VEIKRIVVQVQPGQIDPIKTNKLCVVACAFHPNYVRSINRIAAQVGLGIEQTLILKIIKGKRAGGVA
jgi:hypothetical protein